MADGQTPHRVSQLFCGFVAGDRMDDTSNMEFRKFERLRIDDAPIEVVHRHLKFEVSRSHGAGSPFASATIRRRHGLSTPDNEFARRGQWRFKRVSQNALHGRLYGQIRECPSVSVSVHEGSMGL